MSSVLNINVYNNNNLIIIIIFIERHFQLAVRGALQNSKA